MGIDLDRFEGTVKDGLLCSICRDVLEDPLQAPCEHAFCSTCIRGWLVHERFCPEDRQPLSDSDLRPIFRYMRNDLQCLLIHCINHDNGCDTVQTLEQISYHENQCSLGQIQCPNHSKGCSLVLARHHLNNHLSTCEFRSSLCGGGCGYSVLDSERESHSCISELRTELDILRSEMVCKVEEIRQDFKTRLDYQRADMVEQKSVFQSQLDQFKSVTSQLQHEIRVLHALETKRRRDLERLEIEKKDIISTLLSALTDNKDDLGA
ncbi:E3 ubiquitin-protein ligase NRDP1-like [Apostichopus japonicus]|uniref:E3 ubiquitin-protein ligase NRDP1-like n=1 Tax=Stichopus japonicus TaxID=307972 RepID=UPI003AB4EE94